MALTIDNLEIQIESNATKATSGLDSLAASLTKLKTAVGDTSGLATNLKDIATALHTFSAIGKIRMTIPVNQLKKLESVVPTLGGAQATQMANNLRNIADSIATFSATSGVGKQMKDAAKGMDALTKSTLKLEAANENAKKSNNNTMYSMSSFVNQYRRLYQAIDEVVDRCADWFNESNNYIEALNLFKVSMGDASGAALEYAEIVSEAMGIDPAEWISNQGTFQRMATGFGIASDEAEIMSQNLTQLAYDMSSFFNTDVQTAMEKLQSGMSGQIKGLKVWGYNLSVAALQETALSLGIEESVRNMTEAQKAQLRYITLIQKSNGVMGDMAKTINTPANAMRILDAQIKLMRRSLGNLVSVIATRVIPYIQAFVEVMAESAEALAEAWGFEIKDLPTNNLEMASDVIDGIGDDVDNTSDAVAELKKQLAGFDELNILRSDDSDKSEGVSNSLNIDLPEYDFLSNLDDKTREKIDKIKKIIKELGDGFKELTPLIAGASAALAIGWSVNGITKVINAFKKLPEIQAIITAFTGGMKTFDLAFGAGEGVLKSFGLALKGGIKELRAGLSPMAKFLVVLAGAIITFETFKNNIKGLTDGSKNFGEAMLGIIPVCGLVGVAMYAMLGPWGLVAAAVAGVAGAIYGFLEAENEARKQLVNNAIYNDYGKSVGDLATEFGNLLTASTKAFDIILEKQIDVLTAKDNIKNTKTEIGLLISEVTNGATTIEAAIPRMTAAFESLYNDSKAYLTSTASLLYAALTGSTLEGIEAYMQTISNVTGNTIKEMEESKKRIEEAKKQFEAGTITEDAYWKIYVEESAKVSSWTSIESDLSSKVSDATAGLSELFAEGIKWDSDTLQADLNEIKNGADDAKGTITEAYQSIYDAIAEVRRQAEMQGNTAAILELDKMLVGFQGLEKSDLAKVDNMLNGVLYGLQEDLVLRLNDVLSEAGGKWDKMSWFEKMWYTSEADFKSKAVKDYFNQINKDIISVAEGVFGEDAIFLDGYDTMIYEALFGMGVPTGEGPNNVNNILSQFFSDDGGNVVQGLVDGLSDEQKKAYNASRELGMSVLEAFDEALGIHSPSVEMEKRGNYAIEGLVNGLGDQTTLKTAIDRVVGNFDILSDIQDLWKSVTDWWKNISLPDVDLQMPHFSWTTQPADSWTADVLRAIGLEPKLPKLNVEWYASGGFPTMGQMFIARERGPELVGRIGNKNAVANNDQIITGIASAVYSAMMAAQEDGNNGEGGSARIVVQIGEQAVGEASVRYINGRIVQTGTSPIYN